jgi:hypothetical protein
LADWDADSSRLQANLARVLSSARQHAQERYAPTADLARAWHEGILAGLDAPAPAYVGAYRGEPPLEYIGVRVGHCWGASPGAVADAVQEFIAELTRVLATLDEVIPVGGIPESGDALEAVLTTAALAHAKWVAIHPFANGNGRTARLWANWVLMRYGIPPFVRLRPRPEGVAYAAAAQRALCEGDYEPTIALFFQLFDEFIRG